MTSLRVKDIDTYYGKAQALHRVSLSVGSGRIAAVVGRNGAGKSTLLKSLVGLQALASGHRHLRDDDVTALAPHQLSRRGVAYVPEDRQIFPNLTVTENLAVATFAHRQSDWTAEKVLELFPRLNDRRDAMGGVLSGGEQQMLAIGRALMCGPAFLLLDEPTEGLAPIVVTQLVEAILRIRDRGVGIVLVEQNLRIPLDISDTIHVLESGYLRWDGATEDVRRAPDMLDRYIGV